MNIDFSPPSSLYDYKCFVQIPRTLVIGIILSQRESEIMIQETD